MTRSYRTLNGDVLDKIAKAAGGTETDVTAILEANPGLASEPPALPAGRVIAVPPPAAPAIVSPIRLWGGGETDRNDAAPVGQMPIEAGTAVPEISSRHALRIAQGAELSLDFRDGTGLSRASRYHRPEIKPLGQLIDIQRASAKSRMGANRIIREDAIDLLGPSFDFGFGSAVGIHLGRDVTRQSSWPIMDANWLPVVSAQLTELDLGAFGVLPGVHIQGSNAASAARTSFGAQTAGDVVSGSFIIAAADANDSAEFRIIIRDSVDSLPRIQGARETDGVRQVIDMVELANTDLGDGLRRVDWQYEIRNSGEHDVFLGSNQPDQGIVGLLGWVENAPFPSPLPPLQTAAGLDVQPADYISAPWPDHLHSGAQRHGVRFTLPQASLPGTFDRIYQLGTSDDGVFLYRFGNSQRLVAARRVAGVTFAQVAGPTILPGQEYDVEVTFSPDRLAMVANGEAVETATASLPLEVAPHLYLGSNPGLNERPHGGIYLSEFWAGKLE